MRRILALFVLFGMAALLAAAPASARSVALVIGNDAYGNIPPLQKAVNDARSIAAQLERLGFVVRRVENADRTGMSRALVGFSNDLQPGDEALFFYSGHGFEVGGMNYLLPVDVPNTQAGEADLIRDASFPVERIIDAMTQRGARVSILVLDACRDNPFASAGTRSVPATRGLARVEAPEGVFVLMSAGAKQAALDRLSDSDPDPNSIFTRVLLTEIGKPGQTLVEIAKHTQVAVKRLAASVNHQQTPAYYDQVIGNIVLASTDAAAPVEPASGGKSDSMNVSDNVPTQILTGNNTQAGSGVSLGSGVQIGPGVIIGDKQADIAIQDVANAPKAPDPNKTALLMPSPGAGAPPLSLGTAPIANFMRSNAGWSVTLSLPEAAVAISYRVGNKGEFRDTGLLDMLDQRTGQRMPNPTFQLSGRAKAGIIEVRYRTPDGTEAGPFPIRFDPDVALFDTQRKALEQIWPSWVEFREFDGLLVYFTTLVSYRCAISEVRYGLDNSDPLRRFDLPPCDAKNPYSVPDNATLYLKVPESTEALNLRVTWRDGTQSEAFQKIEK